MASPTLDSEDFGDARDIQAIPLLCTSVEGTVGAPIDEDETWTLYKGRAKLLFSTSMLFLDQYLDFSVLVALLQDGFPMIALSLGASIVVPQLVLWIFLYNNGMTDVWRLLRTLLLPGLALMAIAWQARERSDVVCWAAGMLVLCIEPILVLRRDWPSGAPSPESVWTAVIEGLIEAPSSVVLTMYPSLLKSAVNGEPPSMLFFASIIASLGSITYASTNLHYYASSPSMFDMIVTAIFHKFPVAASQVMIHTVFAFITRPCPTSMTELRMHSSCFLVFAFVAEELAINFAILRSASPRMSGGVACILTFCMIAGGVPGFLTRFDDVRPVHALVQFVRVVIMGLVGWFHATEGHWTTMRECYMPAMLLLTISWLWAGLSGFLMRGAKASISPSAQFQEANAKLDNALLAGDRLMATLLIDVEGAEVLPGLIGAGSLTEKNCIPTGRGPGSAWSGVAACGGKMYFSPRGASEVMVLDLAAAEESQRVTFIETGREDVEAWLGVAELDGKLYCCPHHESDILVIDPSSDEESRRVTFIPTGRTGLHKWHGIASFNGKLYCCPHSESDVLVIDPSATDQASVVSFIPTGRDGNGKWSGIVDLAGKLYCSPSNNADVLVVNPGAAEEAGRVTFIPSGRDGRRKWRGIAATGDRLYCCPDRAAEVMMIDPSADTEANRVTFLSVNNTDADAMGWAGIAALGHLLFCSPIDGNVLVIDPRHNSSRHIHRSQGGRFLGIAACGQVLVCAPSGASHILTFPASVAGESRFQCAERLGLAVSPDRAPPVVE